MPSFNPSKWSSDQHKGWITSRGADQIIFGLGIAPNNVAASFILSRTAPAAHRTLFFSIKQAGMSVGGTMAGLCMAPLVLAAGVVPAVLLFVAGAIASVLIVQVFRHQLDDARSGDRTWIRSFFSVNSFVTAARTLQSNPQLRILAVVGCAFELTMSCVTTFTAVFMIVEHGRSLAEAGRYMAVLLAASAFGRVGLGWASDRCGGGRLLLSAVAVVGGAAVIALSYLSAEQTWLIYAVMALIGTTTMGWTGVHMSEIARVSTLSTATVNLFVFIGSIAGPIAFSLLAKNTNGFTVPFLCVGILLMSFGVFSVLSPVWRGRSGT